MAAAPFLRERLEDLKEDPICRHESAEALGALGDVKSIKLLRRLRDDPSEEDVVRETCEIAVARLEWESGKDEGSEKIKSRYGECRCWRSILEARIIIDVRTL